MKTSEKNHSLSFTKSAVIELNLQQLTNANSGQNKALQHADPMSGPYCTLCNLSMHCPKPTHALIGLSPVK